MQEVVPCISSHQTELSVTEDQALTKVSDPICTGRMKLKSRLTDFPLKERGYTIAFENRLIYECSRCRLVSSPPGIQHGEMVSFFTAFIKNRLDGVDPQSRPLLLNHVQSSLQK